MFNFLHKQVVYDAFQSSQQEFVSSYNKYFEFSELSLSVIYQGLREQIEKYDKFGVKLRFLKKEERDKLFDELFDQSQSNFIESMNNKEIAIVNDNLEQSFDDKEEIFSKLQQLPTKKARVLFLYKECGYDRETVIKTLPAYDKTYIIDIINIENKKDEI